MGINAHGLNRKIPATALALGMALTGGFVVPSMGIDDISATASAATLPASVVTSTSVISNKSGADLLKLPDVEGTRSAYDTFAETHGDQFRINLSFDIPDTAQPGDTFRVDWRSFRTLVTGVIQAPDTDSRNVGSLDVAWDGATFTVSPQVANAINRKANFLPT